MKSQKIYLIATAGLVAMTGLMASAYRFVKYAALPAERLNIPVKPDSTEKENPFDNENLLSARSIVPPLDDPSNLGWTTVVTDSTGQVSLVTPKDVPMLHSYTTRMRAERFSKGKLVLKSTSRGSVKVNGEVVVTKAVSDSTLQAVEGRIELLPEADYDIVIDIVPLPDDSVKPEFSLEYLPDSDFEDVDVSSDPVLPKRVAPQTTQKGERINRASLSDNGKYLILASREVISANETQVYGKLYDAVSGKLITDNIDNSANWLPGQDAFYTTSYRDGNYDVYRTEVPSMKTTLAARSIPDENVTFSPDGRYLFYYKEVKGAKQNGPMHRYANPDSRIPGDEDRSYLMRYDLRSHVSAVLTYGGNSTFIYSITPDGKKILIGTNKQTPDHYPFYNTTLVEMNMETLRTDTIIRGFEASLSSATYSPDGKQLFITAGPSAFDGIGANFAPHEIGNDFDGQGYIYDISSATVRAVTKNFDPAVEGNVVIWNEIDNKIYFIGEKGFGRNIYSLDPKSGNISELKADVPFVRSFSIGDKEAVRLAYTGGSFTRDGAAYLLDMKSGKSRLIADPLAEYTKEVKFGEMSPWKFTAKDGTVIDGYMCLPPDFDPDKKYPLIVYYYGGTSPTTMTFYHLYSPQVFASRDYVVYTLNPSGTTGYGQEFSARHVNAWGKRTAEEIIEGTKKFCDEHPFVDTKKIGCIGASYGGFMTQYLQTLTDMFACAVSHAGISNVTSYWGEGYWGYSYNSVAAAKSYPWTDPELYTKQGSLFNADKIHTPLLLLHGTVDTNVPIGESIQLFNALKILGREVEFITVKDENHVISGYDNKLVWQNTIMAWFAKWLQDDPRWWNSMYK